MVATGVPNKYGFKTLIRTVVVKSFHVHYVLDSETSLVKPGDPQLERNFT